MNYDVPRFGLRLISAERVLCVRRDKTLGGLDGFDGLKCHEQSSNRHQR